MASVLQLKLTLLDVKPPIWRRLRVPGQISLEQLHQLIQVLAGWGDAHQHEFVIADKRYGQSAPREVVPVYDENLYRLHSLSLATGAVTYVYDFGDHWDVEAKVEKTLVQTPGGAYPVVLEGARAFPPEDSGGASGYQGLLEALSDRVDSEFEESRRWVGSGFDPERFDLRETNERLRSLF
jgi:hypothetical protein